MTLVEPPSFDPLANVMYAGFSFSSDIMPFIAVAFLLMCSALISASEVAFFSLSPAEKETLRGFDNKNSKLALDLLNKPKDLLATILIYNNFVNVGVVIISSSIVASYFEHLEGFETVRFIIEIFAITLILLLIGEVIPKVYASKNSLRIALSMARVLQVLNVLPPFSWIRMLLVNGSNIISRSAKRKGYKISSDELEAALALTKEEHTSHEEHKILEGIVKFGNTDVKQIMKPRMEVVSIDNTTPLNKVLAIILDCGYSRIPVFENSFDNVTGILFIKDLLPYLNENDDFNWQNLLRKPFFVPENKKIDDLLKEFQNKKVHMAIVVDEYGGSSGVVTLEDILEEIVGDITDEFDDVELIYTKIDDQTYLFEGRTALVDFYKVLDIDGKEFETTRGDAETLGGFMVENAGKILKNNEYLVCDHIKLIVESSDKKRIKMIKAVLQQPINEE